MSFEVKPSTSESDDEEFMDRVNFYLNSQDSAGQSNSALEGILKRTSSFNKSVKFEIDEAEREDARLDAERSRQELLSKIARLTDMLKEAENQISLERDKRKKKEKNLMKLAKELKKRNLQKEKDMDKMEEVSRSIVDETGVRYTFCTDNGMHRQIVGREEAIPRTSLGTGAKRA